jgi:acyl-CoA reductase-like NAD-dependent aldehyde dehydrogenase
MAQGAPVSDVPARRTITVTSPATGVRQGEYTVSDQEAVAAVVARAREAQKEWASLGFTERGRTLRKVRDRFVDEKDRICDVVSGETGKPRHDVITNELLFLCDAIGFWSKRAEKFLADEPARPHLVKSKRAYVSYVPHGVIGIIGPWNFPFNLTIGEAIPALMAGNAVVIKPSEVTPGSAVLGAQLAEAAGLPPGLLQVVTGYGETGQHLIDLADMVCFTGSVATGRKVAERCGQLLKPVTLELGGKDPMIVLGDADLERASNACVYGGLANSGQVCISVERV